MIIVTRRNSPRPLAFPVGGHHESDAARVAALGETTENKGKR